jgi:hypothetical protein
MQFKSCEVSRDGKNITLKYILQNVTNVKNQLNVFWAGILWGNIGACDILGYFKL